MSPSPRLADWRPGHLAPATFHSGEIVMKPLTLPTLPPLQPPLPLSTYKLFHNHGEIWLKVPTKCFHILDTIIRHYETGLLRDYVIFAKSSFAALHSTGARRVKLTTSELLVCSGEKFTTSSPGQLIVSILASKVQRRCDVEYLKCLMEAMFFQHAPLFIYLSAR